MEKDKKYIAEIDVMKAIGIILVVVGHSFPDASSSNGISCRICSIIYEFIYSFHMPAFFFASGIVSYKFYKLSSAKKIAIRKRMIRLMIPYFVWGGIYVPFRILLGKYSSEPFELKAVWKILIGENPYSGLWFLYALFFVSIIHIILVNSEKRLTIFLGISVLGILINEFILVIEPFRWIFAYSFYYFLGMIFRKHYNKIEVVLQKRSYLIFFNFSFFIMFILKIKMKEEINYSFVMIPAVFGILMLFTWSLKMKNIYFLQKIGKYSMDIYILSGPILVALRIGLYRIIGLNYYVYTMLAIFLGCVLSILLSSIVLRRNKYMSFLLLGMKYDL